MGLRTWEDFIATYLRRLSPSEREFFDRKRAFFAEENRRICQHRNWYTSNPPVCVNCGLVGSVD